MTTLTVQDHYLNFRPAAGHAEGCSRRGTSLFEIDQLAEARVRSQARGGDYTETTLRLLCRECGAARLLSTDQALLWESTHIDRIGYGRQPEKCAGLFLHPGPLWDLSFTDDLGPHAYLVTAAKGTPHVPEDVLGWIGWWQTRRGATRWAAGYGLNEYGRPVHVPEPNEFASRTASVRWIKEQQDGDRQ